MKKTYKLKSAEVGGQVHSDCSLLVDEEAQTAEVLTPAGLLRKNLARLESIPYGAKTKVQLEGAAIKIGSVTLIAGDDATAKEISSVLLGPSRAAEKSSADLRGLQDSVFAFLRTRQRGIDFLLQLKRDPRQANVDKAPSYTGKSEDPGQEYIEGVNLELSEAYTRMGTFARSLKEGAEKAAVEKVYAFVYATCSSQDEFLRKGEQSKETTALMDELGVQTKLNLEPKAGTDLEAILRSASPLFSH